MNAVIPLIFRPTSSASNYGILAPPQLTLLTFGQPAGQHRSLIIQAKYGTFAVIKFKTLCY
jgi:hypothetical protein